MGVHKHNEASASIVLKQAFNSPLAKMGLKFMGRVQQDQAHNPTACLQAA